MFKDKKSIKIGLFYGFLALVVIGLSLYAWNQFSKKQTIQKDIPTEEQILPEERQEKTSPTTSAIDLEQKSLQEKREQLDNTQWEITIVPSSETRNSLWDKDTIKFINGEISSRQFENTGYLPSRYTVRVRDGKGSWETMQRDKNGKTIIFWRGEWENNQMKGMFSIQKDSDNNIKSYSFQSVSKENVK